MTENDIDEAAREALRELHVSIHVLTKEKAEMEDLMEECLLAILDGQKDYHHDIRNAITKAFPIIQKAVFENEAQNLMKEIDTKIEALLNKGKRVSGMENKKDNQIDNLELSCGLGEHSTNHSKGYRDGFTKGLRDAKNTVNLKLAQEIKSELEDRFNIVEISSDDYQAFWKGKGVE